MSDESKDLVAAKDEFTAICKSLGIPTTDSNTALFLTQCEKQYRHIEIMMIKWIEDMEGLQKKGRNDRLWQTVTYQSKIDNLLVDHVRLVFDAGRSSNNQKIVLLGMGLGGFLAIVTHALASSNVLITGFFAEKKVISYVYPSIKNSILKKSMRQIETFRDRLQLLANDSQFGPLHKRLAQIANKSGLAPDQKTVLAAITMIFDS